MILGAIKLKLFNFTARTIYSIVWVNTSQDGHWNTFECCLYIVEEADICI